MPKKIDQANEEYFKEYNKQWYKNNPEYNKQHYQNNKEYYKEHNKHWRENNKEINLTTLEFDLLVMFLNNKNKKQAAKKWLAFYCII